MFLKSIYLAAKEIQSKASWRDGAAIALIVIAFSWICYRNLNHPGPYGDEAWAAAPAVRFVQGQAVIDPTPYHQFHLFGRTFPYMPGDYIGPIQVYVISAFFAVFGISVPVLRIATSVVGLLGVLAMYFLIRREFGRVAAFFSSLLVATDLSYVLAVRHDFGVISFGLLARMLSLFFFLAWIRSRDSLRNLFLSFLVLGLAVTYRFDYASFIVAALIGMVLFYGLWLRPRIKLQEIGLAVGGFLIGAFPILLFNYFTGGQTFQQGRAIGAGTGRGFFPTTLNAVWPFLQLLPEALAKRVTSLSLLTEGTGGNWILGESVDQFSPLGPAPIPLAVKIAVPLLLVLVALPHFRKWRRPLGFLVAIFILTLIFIAATPIAIGPHHILSLYPLPHMLVGLALAGIWSVAEERPPWLLWTARGAAVIAISWMILTNLTLARAFHHRLIKQGGDAYCTEAIYELSDQLKGEYAGKNLVVLDWGFEQPLVILGKDKFKQEVVFWRVLSEEAPGPWLSTMIKNPNNLFLIRAEQFAFKDVIHKRFKEAYSKEKDLVVDERKYYRKNGTHVFSVLTFRAQTSN
ncbi:MAG TPA: glycosyltransferase family 39 protein [Pyrinomonadaceae bacterium]|nr:glycosyltransferase family 39 protein [Pyrinomonadaceae bacterium]